MGILVELTHYFDDKRWGKKSVTEKLFVRDGQEFNILNASISQVSIPVRCNKCGNSGILIAEDIKMNAEVHERKMGEEFYHYGKGSGNCTECEQDMEISIGLLEYSEDIIKFEDGFIDEPYNCSYDKNRELDDG